MSSEGRPAVEGVQAVGPRIYRLSAWFDPESAAVVTILLGLFQILLSVLLAYAEKNLPKFFVLPFVIGILIVAGGSFTMASERNPSRLLLRGCACSNVVGLLGAVLAFCLYCYSLSRVHNEPCVSIPTDDYYYRHTSYGCPTEFLTAYNWSVTVLLMLYDSGAILLHCVLSFCAIRALKTD
ncbi:uncharacterized protein si:dkey-9i23.16 [Antennarius striatus]|uniref:uncharacterized protein si:dkey-9i23.16 n=1 Tax=Antennarius striatus TaxID=241820 RepID=UPI0035AE0746